MPDHVFNGKNNPYREAHKILRRLNQKYTGQALRKDGIKEFTIAQQIEILLGLIKIDIMEFPNKSHILSTRDEHTKFSQAHVLPEETIKSVSSTILLYFQPFSTSLRISYDYSKKIGNEPFPLNTGEPP